MSDEKLIEACLQGKEIACQELFERFSPKMMGVCLRYAIDEDEAQDMLQDGFIKVFKKLKSYNAQGSFEGWIRRTIVNTCLDHIRKNKNKKLNVDITEVTSNESGVDELVTSDLATQELLKLIQQLPTGYRTVFNMFAIEGYSHKEIGDELGISENTSKSQFRKAKLQLQEWIKAIELNWERSE